MTFGPLEADTRQRITQDGPAVLLRNYRRSDEFGKNVSARNLELLNLGPAALLVERMEVTWVVLKESFTITRNWGCPLGTGEFLSLLDVNSYAEYGVVAQDYTLRPFAQPDNPHHVTVHVVSPAGPHVLQCSVAWGFPIRAGERGFYLLGAPASEAPGEERVD